MPLRDVLAAAGLAASLLHIPTSAAAQTVGVAISVTQGAFVESDGIRHRLATRGEVSNGDAILTDASGTVQLAFRDRTRIVVGPNTRFEIDRVALNSEGRASRFAVAILGGVFRFLSGESAKESYEVRTPTATMGIRGTAFDVAVDARRRTRLVTFEGVVRFCSRWSRCAAVTGGCAMAQTRSFGRVAAPEDKRERDAALNTLFPFVTGNQARLDAAFRTRTESCGDIDPLLILRTPPAPSPLAAAASSTRFGGRDASGARGTPEAESDGAAGENDGGRDDGEGSNDGSDGSDSDSEGAGGESDGKDSL